MRALLDTSVLIEMRRRPTSKPRSALPLLPSYISACSSPSMSTNAPAEQPVRCDRVDVTHFQSQTRSLASGAGCQPPSIPEAESPDAALLISSLLLPQTFMASVADSQYPRLPNHQRPRRRKAYIGRRARLVRESLISLQ